MNRFFRTAIYLVLFVALAAFWTSAAPATEIFIPALTAKSGRSVAVPIKINQVENLAGIKLVLKYDPDILTFTKAVRSEQSASLMHIVNDKKPGILIVVMAGAKGIKGKDFPIISLFFNAKKGLKNEQTADFAITECELMSDTLKKLDCSTKVNPLVISAPARE